MTPVEIVGEIVVGLVFVLLAIEGCFFFREMRSIWEEQIEKGSKYIQKIIDQYPDVTFQLLASRRDVSIKAIEDLAKEKKDEFDSFINTTPFARLKNQMVFLADWKIVDKKTLEQNLQFIREVDIIKREIKENLL